MRSNELVLLLRNEGFERGTRLALLRIVEELEDHRRTYKEMASAFEALARVQTMLNGAVDGMDTKIKEMGKRDDDPRSTREMLT